MTFFSVRKLWVLYLVLYDFNLKWKKFELISTIWQDRMMTKVISHESEGINSLRF